MRVSLLTLCANLAIAGSVFAQDLVSVFEGPLGGHGTVSLYDAQTGAFVASPPELALVQWLAFDFAGRTELYQFHPGRPRRFTDLANAARLRLPQGHGSLYHFARPGVAGQSSYGFVLVPPTGLPRILLERPGIGVGGGRNPFLSHVAVTPDGSAILVATQGEAGGDLLEISTVGSPTVFDRTANTAPARIFPWGLVLGPTHGFAMTNFGLLRFDRASAADASFVTFGADAPPTYYSGNLATSDNLNHVVFTAGTSPSQLNVYSASGSGVARRATTSAGVVSPMGSATDGTSGPWLAVSDDGLWCAWRTTIGVANECMVARAELTPSPAEQLSSDARFLDTLDEVALFAFRGPGRLQFAVGEQNPGGFPGKMDLFSADLSTGAAPQISNLTQTSGQTVAPFTVPPDLEPSTLVMLPDQSGILIHDDGGQAGDLFLWREGQPGLSVVLPSVKSFDSIDFGGPGASLGVRRGNNTREFHRATSALTGLALVASSATGASFEHPLARGDGWTAFIESTAVSGRLDRIDTLGGAGDSLLGGPAQFGGAMGWSSSGSLVFTRIQNGTHVHVAWPIAARPVRMLTTGVVGQVLPSY